MYTMIFLYYVSLLVTLLAFLTLLALWGHDLYRQHKRKHRTPVYLGPRANIRRI